MPIRPGVIWGPTSAGLKLLDMGDDPDSSAKANPTLAELRAQREQRERAYLESLPNPSAKQAKRLESFRRKDMTEAERAADLAARQQAELAHLKSLKFPTTSQLKRLYELQRRQMSKAERDAADMAYERGLAERRAKLGADNMSSGNAAQRSVESKRSWFQENKPQGVFDGAICVVFIWWGFFFVNLVFGYGPFTQDDAAKAMVLALILTLGWMAFAKD